MNQGVEMTVVSEKTYLVFFSICTVIASVVFFILATENIIEYNLGINIFTSLITTVITVIFLSIFLTLREEREWKVVRSAVYSMIGMELGSLFGEVLRLTESEMEEIGFKSSLLYTKDAKIRKEMIFSKLSQLHKKEPLQLASSSVSIFLSDKELSDTFLDIKRNLGDVQIRYGKHLNSKTTESLIKLQELLELMNMSFKFDMLWTKLQTQLPLLNDLMKKLMPDMHDQKLSSVDLMQNVLPACVKSLIQVTYEMWKMEIEFDMT
jgi:uncharacterized membrane protein YjfL (UPF0719 family)